MALPGESPERPGSPHPEARHHLVYPSLHEQSETDQDEPHPDRDDGLRDGDHAQTGEKQDDSEHSEQTEGIQHVRACKRAGFRRFDTRSAAAAAGFDAVRPTTMGFKRLAR